MIGDCVHYCLSLIDASATGELTEEGYYQEEEEEDYPGHFANQGKPSFDHTITQFLMHVYLLLKKSALLK
jgi:hypothetical protein